METDFSCGIVPTFLAPDGERQFLLVQHHRGHWGFPKGHPEKGETDIQAARREFIEETGIAEVELVDKPAFDESYIFTKKSGKVVRKRVRYFIGTVSDTTLNTQPEEIADATWDDADATRDRLTFEESRTLLDRVLEHLDGTKG